MQHDELGEVRGDGSPSPKEGWRYSRSLQTMECDLLKPGSVVLLMYLQHRGWPYA